jgi:eukaryotic-like serine/threonine-protein kinase
MGAVWRAEDTLLQRDVAVKEIEFPSALTPDEAEAMKVRAMREARSAGGLSSPNVVTIFDVIHEAERGYIVMEFVEAPTLAEVIARAGPVPVERAARIGLDVLSALRAAHAKGIVHRDVKPANVMIPEIGRAKLADFGIASVKDDPKITATGLVLGSPQFMAPEQASGTRTGPETDLWALGATLYYAVEGELPFDRGETIPTLAAVVHDPPRRMTRAGRMQPIIEALLAKDPHARPDADDLWTWLERIAAAPAGIPAHTLPIAVEPEVPQRERPTPGGARSGRPSGRALIAGALVILAVAGAVGFALTRDDPRGGVDRSAGGERTEGNDSGEGRGPDQETDSSDRKVPADWETYTDEAAGYTIAHPPGWDVVASGDTQIDIRHPSNGTYLRVGWRSPPGPSAVGAWESLSDDFAASHDNYEEIRIQETTFKGSDNAAVWEFTYEEGGASLHAVDLGFVLGDYGFALNFQTHSENWESSQDLFEAFKASFRPPR